MRPGRAADRRLLRHDAHRDRGDRVRRRRGRKPRARLEFAERELVVALGGEAAETGLLRALVRRVRRLGAAARTARRQRPGARRRRPGAQGLGRVGFVDVNDNAGARAGMARSWPRPHRAVVRDQTVPHLTTRDWTIMGLESVLFGAHAGGVRNILAVTGDPPEVGDYPGSLRIGSSDRAHGAHRPLNKGEDFNGGRSTRRPRSTLAWPSTRLPTISARARPLPPEDRRGRGVRDDAARLRPRPSTTSAASPRSSSPSFSSACAALELARPPLQRALESSSPSAAGRARDRPPAAADAAA